MLTIIPDFIPSDHVWNPTTKGNYSQGRLGKSVKILVLHDTEGNLASARGVFRDKQAQVSAHYIIDVDGTVYQQVNEGDTAYHAGVSLWGGYVNINSVSIGIELVYLVTDNGPYPEPQYRACVELSKQIVKRYNIPKEMVARHLDVAIPLGRKRDPRNFPWQQFQADVFSAGASPSPTPPQVPTPTPPQTTPSPPPKSAGGEAFIIWLLDVIKRWLESV